MRNIAMMASCLLALVAPSWGQQNRQAAPDACEIRAYLMNKDRQTVDIVGITAVLIVEGKDGVDLRIPLQGITPKAEEKSGLHSSIAPREVEGTEYFASLITVPPYGNRQSESDDADRRLAKGSTPGFQGKQESAPAESDRKLFALEGPYFKADLTREQLGALTCQSAVRFTIKGENRSAKGFNCVLSKGSVSQMERCPRLAEECNQVERHLKAGELDKAGAVVDRLSSSLCEPCGEVACRGARHGCASCCKDLRAALSAGNREKALTALEALKSPCSPCSSSKSEPRTNGDRK